MKIRKTPEEMQRLSARWRAEGESIGFVPTMGYLHEGHERLLAEARKKSGKLILSIFVNPLQFGPNEDFATYPRDDARDRAIARRQQVDAIFYPTPAMMYPEGYAMRVHPGEMGDVWEGAFRPGFFTGVCTVVLKLFTITQPHTAWFGLKDFQQFTLVDRMVKDFNLPLKLIGVPTVREADGLAMSSRNVYLSAEERQRALCLSEAIGLARAALASGVLDARKLESIMTRHIRRAGAEIDYAAVVDPATLVKLKTVSGPARALLAARVGKTRLIDNDEIRPKQAARRSA